MCNIATSTKRHHFRYNSAFCTYCCPSANFSHTYICDKVPRDCLCLFTRTRPYQVCKKRRSTLLPAVHFLEQAFAGADFSTEKFSAALSLISAALFQCPKIAKFSVAHFFKLSCDLRCSFSIAKSRKILRCSSSDIWKGSKLSCREY